MRPGRTRGWQGRAVLRRRTKVYTTSPMAYRTRTGYLQKTARSTPQKRSSRPIWILWGVPCVHRFHPSRSDWGISPGLVLLLHIMEAKVPSAKLSLSDAQSRSRHTKARVNRPYPLSPDETSRQLLPSSTPSQTRVRIHSHGYLPGTWKAFTAFTSRINSRVCRLSCRRGLAGRN